MERKKVELPKLKKTLSRKPAKKKAPVKDTRKGSALAHDAPTAVISQKAKSPKDRALIAQALNKHFIFTSLSAENREMVIEQMTQFNINANQIVFEQGQPGDYFFIIAVGSVQVIVNGNSVKELRAGDSFGELALLHDAPRSASVKTTAKTTLWGLERKTFRTALERLNAQNYHDTRQVVESVPLFQVLNAAQRESLIASLSALKFRVDEAIVNEGDPGDLFYFITEGSVSVRKSNTEIRKMYPGEYFGEQALLYNTHRTASIVALSEVKCLAIGRQRLIRVLGSQLQRILYRNSIRMALEKSGVLSKLQSEHLAELVDALTVQSFSQREVVIPAGTPKGRQLWIVLNGKLLQNTTVVAEVLSCFGDDCLTGAAGEVYTTDLCAGSENTDVAVLNVEDLEQVIGGSLHEIVEVGQTLSVFRRIRVFMELPEDQLMQLVRALQVTQFESGQPIVEQDSVGDCFYIIKEGKVDVLKNGEYLRTITKLDYFGERSLLLNEARSASVVANTPVTCWVLHRQDFLHHINEGVRMHLMRRIELQDVDFGLEDLAAVKLLGKGMFGNVFLVVHKTKHRLYALKTVDRRKIQRYEIQENLVLERKILLQLDNSLIMKLVKTFKDRQRIYFLLEFVRGMDLFDVLRKLGLVGDTESRFYVACLILILEHLHERDIIYRDLKPENVMIDEEGYPRLIDFGTAKIVNGRTFTIVGTPHYMAPEVIVGKGYGTTADFWSIGIMLYEFMCGAVPFGEEEEDPYAVYQQVLAHKLVYTNYMNPKSAAKPLIEQLLNKNSAMRTGGSIDNLKEHPWFAEFPWDGVLTKQLKPPYIPKTNDLTREIQLALMQNQELTGMIAREENADEMSEPPVRVPPTSTWDAEF